MEPHRNIANNRNKHIEFYVGTYVSMYYVVQKDCKFS